MDPFVFELFLGFPVDEEYSLHLSRANPHRVALFISEDSPYLHETQLEGQRFLGKRLGDSVELPQLSLVRDNIRSLAYKLVKEVDPFAGREPTLFAIATTRPTPS